MRHGVNSKLFFGVLKLPFINFAYDENGKGAAQVLPSM